MAVAQRITQAPVQQIQQMGNVEVGLTTLQGFELAQRAAKMLSMSTLVPKDYQNNLSNCVIALNMAQRMGADALQIMQNLVVVHGRPTWSAQFLIATFNSCGRYSSLKYEFQGKEGTDDYGCRAYATELSTGEKLVGPLVTIGIAKKEGWYGRNGSKWQTMPEQMLRYRSASWFVRTTAPELSMGLHTTDEIHDTFDAVPNDRGTYEVAAEEQVIQGESIQEFTQDDVDAQKERIAQLVKTNRTARSLKSETVDKETGEILDEKTAQAVSVDEAEEAIDPLMDMRLALEDCQSISDVVRLYDGLDADAKKDEAIRSLITERQDQIKAEKGLA